MTSFLFVVGQGRSGTTALARVVGSHQRIALGIERYKRLWSLNGDIGAFGPDHFARSKFFDFDDNLTNLTPEFHRRYRKWYREVRAKYGTAAYVGDKVTQPFRLPALAEQFPRPKFVCIVRDVYEVAHSWQARADDEADRWGAERGAIEAVDTWNAAAATIEECHRSNPGQVMVIDHTAFFGAHDNAPLEPLMQFLDLETDDSLRAGYEEAREKYQTSVSGKRRELPPQIVDHINATLRPHALQTLLSG